MELENMGLDKRDQIITCSRDCYFMIEYSSMNLCTIFPSSNPPPMCFSAAYPGAPCRFDQTKQRMNQIEKKAMNDKYIEKILKDLSKARKPKARG
ncbi:hypothetical protein GF378_01480 [Candidatus Pacearchaeota archaeon]|nr:hypothetical protein [Candidatus Pacearchaeota archaeon]